MIRTGLLLLTLAAAAEPRTKAAALQFNDLRGGRWAVKVSGLLCTACTRAVTTELSKLEAVDTVKADFDKQEFVIVVKNDRVLTTAALRKALKRAAKRVNLGTRFEPQSVVYKPL